MIFIFGLILLGWTVFSYSLIDLNLTLLNNSLWQKFRESIIQIGYFHRDISWTIYLTLICLLFVFHYFFVRNHKRFDPFKLAFFIAIILFFSYPMLSHDLFNYIFDAKILTYYHLNPYMYMAGDFYRDPWIRFMHWTNRPYPYGPTFLPLTLIPSFLGGTKFILQFFLFKLLFLITYLFAVYRLSKIHKKWAIILATQPLILIEGLVSAHNDIVGMSFAVVGVTYLLEKRKYLGYFFLLFSAGIKYITAPLVFIQKNNKLSIKVVVSLLLVTLVYLSLRSEIQPWYFLAIFALIPFYEQFIQKLNIFFLGLLLSYYPYIRLGGWDSAYKIELKHQIILVCGILNILYLLFDYFRSHPESQFLRRWSFVRKGAKVKP